MTDTEVVFSPAMRDRLAAVLQRFPTVEAAYLFGSVASGRATQDSDVDLGVHLNMEPRPGLRLELLTALTDAGFDDVDLAFLGSGDVVLRYEAVRPNHLVFARPAFDHGAYYSRALREYFDLQPILKIQREALRRRLQRAQD